MKFSKKQIIPTTLLFFFVSHGALQNTSRLVKEMVRPLTAGTVRSFGTARPFSTHIPTDFPNINDEVRRGLDEQESYSPDNIKAAENRLERSLKFLEAEWQKVIWSDRDNRWFWTSPKKEAQRQAQEARENFNKAVSTGNLKQAKRIANNYDSRAAELKHQHGPYVAELLGRLRYEETPEIIEIPGKIATPEELSEFNQSKASEQLSWKQRFSKLFGRD